MCRWGRRIAIASALALASPALAAAIKGTVKLPHGMSPEDSVVYVAAIPGKQFPAPTKPMVLDQLRKRFTPHVLVIQKGQKVLFPNSDLIRHNVFSPSKVHRFNLGIYPPGTSKEETFDEAGVVALLCALHPEMSAYIIVTDTPWAMRVGPDGKFALAGVPPGSYELVAWHEGMPESRASVQVKSADVEQDIVIHRGD